MKQEAKKRGKSTDRLCVWAVRSGHGIQEAGPNIYLRTFCRWHLPNPNPTPSTGQGCHGLSGLNKYPLFVASRATITCQFASNFFLLFSNALTRHSSPHPLFLLLLQPIKPFSSHFPLLLSISHVVSSTKCLGCLTRRMHLRVTRQLLNSPCNISIPAKGMNESLTDFERTWSP